MVEGTIDCSILETSSVKEELIKQMKKHAENQHAHSEQWGKHNKVINKALGHCKNEGNEMTHKSNKYFAQMQAETVVRESLSGA